MAFIHNVTPVELALLDAAGIDYEADPYETGTIEVEDFDVEDALTAMKRSE